MKDKLDDSSRHTLVLFSTKTIASVTVRLLKKFVPLRDSSLMQ